MKLLRNKHKGTELHVERVHGIAQGHIARYGEMTAFDMVAPLPSAVSTGLSEYMVS